MSKRTNLKTWLVISVFLLGFSGSVSATGTYDGGDGSPGDPFQINTPAQMDEIGQHSEDWASCFILTADIDLSGYTGTAFNIIGNSSTKFTGVFDGDDHTISNFTYTSIGASYMGLFGYVGAGGEIKNLGMVGVYVNAGAGDNVGGLVGWNDGTISNCHATGNVSGEWDVGGLVGWNYGTLLNCHAAGYVSGDYSVGGLVGDNYGTLSNCHATGTVTATGSYVGGLVGWNYDGTVSNCYATGDVSGDNFVGGLVGINDGTVSNCYATGGVWGDCDVGGLVGDNYGTLSNCYAAGYVSGDYSVGGLVGYDFSGSYTSCFWDSTVNSGLTGVGNISDPPDVMGRTTAQMQTESTFTDYGWDFDDIWLLPADGITYPYLAWAWEEPSYSGSGTAGDPYQISTAEQMDEIGRWPFDWDKYFILTADIDLSAYTGTAFHIIGNTTTNFTGVFDGDDHTISNFTHTSIGASYMGLFGYVGTGGEIKNVGMVGVYVNTGTGIYVGGLAGYNSGTISNCYATGGVSGRDMVGGLVGHSYGTITNCYTTGTVTATLDDIGGLVGVNDGSIYESFSTCAVTGPDDTGGLVGRSWGGIISNCYSTGSVNGSIQVGGLVGDNTAIISNCYATGAVSGSSDVGGLVGYSSGSYTSCFWDSTVNSGLTGVGNISDPPDVMGRTTAQMQTESTFTDYGWDFVGETANGTDDIWMIGEGVYPWLGFFVDAANYANYDLVKSGYVDWKDLDAFTDEWLNDCNSANNWCDGADFDQSGDVGFDDFGLWAQYWLSDFLGDLDHLLWSDVMSEEWEQPAKLDDFIGVHPRYLLTAAKVTDLKSKIASAGVHQDIWLNVVKPKADWYLTESPYGGHNEDVMRPSGRAIPWLALAYLMTDNTTYSDKAISWMLTVCGYEDWVGNASLGGAAGLVGVSIGYDWLYDVLGEPNKVFIRDKLIDQAQKMAPSPTHKERWLANHNHVEHNGLAAAGFVLYGDGNAPDANDWIRQADLVFQTAFVAGSSDGSSTEGHSYWGYSMESILCYTEAARDLMGKDYYDSKWIEGATDFIIFCTLPDFNTIPGEPGYANCLMAYGDSYPDYRSHGPTHILCRLASEYNNGFAQWLGEEMIDRGVGVTQEFDYRAWANLLWYDDTVTPTSLSALSTFKHFDDIGLVTSRSGWDEDAVMVSFKCGPFHGHKVQPYYEKQVDENWPETKDPNMEDLYGFKYHGLVGGHCQPDVGSFQIYAHGKWLATEPGYSRYTASRMKHTKDHCTILAGFGDPNDRGQVGEWTLELDSSWIDKTAVIDAKAASSIIKAESCAEYDYIIGDAENIYRDPNLSKFLRHFIYIKPDVIVIVDELEDASPPSADYFQWRLRAKHARPNFEQDVNIVLVQDPNYYRIENQDDLADIVVMDVHFVHPELSNFSTSIETVTEYYGNESKFLVADFDSTSGGDLLATVLHPRRDEDPACSITSSSYVSSVLYLTISIGAETINVELDLAAQEVTIY